MKKLSSYYIKNEFMGILSNWYIPFFGIAFPLFMGQIISRAVLPEVPKIAVHEVSTSIALSMLQIVPLAVVFLGHSSMYSQDVEKKIPLRMQLYGFSQSTQMASRLLAMMIFFTIGIGINILASMLTFDMAKPTVKGFILTMLLYYILGGILFMLAHGIANFVRKFGPTYGISMTIYFLFMILGGMMGIRQEQLPEALQTVSKLLPFNYMSREAYKIWTGASYNWAPLMQSLLFLGGISAIVMLLSFRYRKGQAI